MNVHSSTKTFVYMLNMCIFFQKLLLHDLFSTLFFKNRIHLFSSLVFISLQLIFFSWFIYVQRRFFFLTLLIHLIHMMSCFSASVRKFISAFWLLHNSSNNSSSSDSPTQHKATWLRFRFYTFITGCKEV